jgi:hypothetical protein
VNELFLLYGEQPLWGIFKRVLPKCYTRANGKSDRDAIFKRISMPPLI